MLFAVFSLSSTDDSRFLPLFRFHPRITSAFWQILHFVDRRQTFFTVFRISSADDEYFFAISTFRRPTTGCFYRFSRFGAPRRLVFQIFRASGLPESLFSGILRLRDSPTVHFHKKQLVGASRNIVFPNFTLSGCPEAHFFPFSEISQCRDEPMIPFLYLMKYKSPQSKSACIAHRQMDCKLPICFYQTAIKNCISATANSQKSKKLHFGHGRFAESRVFLLAFIQEK